MTNSLTNAQLLERIHILEQRLERADQELQAFAYIASHDLQEPLRKVNAFGQRLFDMNAEHLDARSLDYLQRMLGASSRMQAMLSGLLAYSRIVTHGNAFEWTNLRALAREVAESFNARLTPMHGRIVVSDLPSVECDAQQIRQLLNHLLDNALKFCHDGVPPIITITMQETQNSHEAVIISVRDNGIGFNAHQQQAIFQLFQKLHGHQYPGPGMGLSIARRIAERHHGTLTADSVPGMGAVFTLKLPRHQSSHLPDEENDDA